MFQCTPYNSLLLSLYFAVMKKNIALLLICFLTLYFNNTLVLADDDDEAKIFETAQFIDGQALIHIEEEVQSASGIKTQKLKAINFNPEFIAYGKAIDISPLLSLHNQYLSSLAKKTGAKARLNTAEKSISRLRQLHLGEAISTRKLQNQQSQWQSEQAIYNEMAYQNKIIINNSKLQWGATVTHWLTTPASKQLEKLLNSESTLLKISLPADKSLPENTAHIYIDNNGNRNSASKAEFVSQLPQIDAISQGPQYLFLTETPTIKIGMNVSAWIALKNDLQTGVIIPESSLAWHLGQAFVFVKIDDQTFAHRNITQVTKVANGYFVENQLAAGEELVTTGTQMLLSHEFRSQIPDEDDDD